MLLRDVDVVINVDISDVVLTVVQPSSNDGSVLIIRSPHGLAKGRQPRSFHPHVPRWLHDPPSLLQFLFLFLLQWSGCGEDSEQEQQSSEQHEGVLHRGGSGGVKSCLP